MWQTFSWMEWKIHPEKWDEGSCKFKKYSCDFAYIDHCGNVASRTEQTILMHSTSNKPRQPSDNKNRNCSVWTWTWKHSMNNLVRLCVADKYNYHVTISNICLILEVHKGVRNRRVHVSDRDMLLLYLSDKEIDDCVTWTKVLSSFTKTARSTVT